MGKTCKHFCLAVGIVSGVLALIDVSFLLLCCRYISKVVKVVKGVDVLLFLCAATDIFKVVNSHLYVTIIVKCWRRAIGRTLLFLKSIAARVRP